MKNQVLNRFVIVVLLGIFALIIAVPGQTWTQMLGEKNPVAQKLNELKITLGLDLAGGTELDYEIDLTQAEAQNNDDDPDNNVLVENIVESVRDALERRVNPAGVGEIIVKRSQIDGEEHVLIQMPPNTDIEKAKRDAEKDNRLEFFAEDPSLETAKRFEIAELLTVDLNASNWEEKTSALTANSETVQKEKFGPLFADQITNPQLAEKLAAVAPGVIIQDIIEMSLQPKFTVTESGEVKIEGSPFPRNVLAVARLLEKTEEAREKELAAEATARHILISYKGAQDAAESENRSKEEALKLAETTLSELKGGADFATLAQERSGDSSNKDKGGDLGTFGPGVMVTAFNDAVFNAGGPKLIEEVIETPFGFHLIEVQSLTEKRTETVTEPKYTYELLSWDRDELSWVKTPLGGSQLDAARVGFDEVGNALVDLRFDSEGGQLFEELTGLVASRKCASGPCRIGIKVGGNWITTPTVREKIIGRSAQITGSFTFESANELANGLNLGAIAAPVKLSGQTSIEAELGQEQFSKSVKAAAFGLIATTIFMVLMYRLAGAVAGVSLILYTLFFIAILKLWPESFGGPIVLSLAGAAGIALSIGLAVDGNILIFERMKEELGRGRSLRQAVDLGFERAWSAIRDSNLSTLLTCVILFSIGNSIIKGFAIMLIIGTVLSMFTAVTISRSLLHAVLQIPAANNPALFGVTERKKKRKSSKK